MIFFEQGGPGAYYLSIKGRARVAPELDDVVYARMIERERGQDPERKGVAVVIDVDRIEGAGAAGYFLHERVAA